LRIGYYQGFTSINCFFLFYFNRLANCHQTVQCLVQPLCMGEEVYYIRNDYKPMPHIGQNSAPYSSQPSRKNLSLKSCHRIPSGKIRILHRHHFESELFRDKSFIQFTPSLYCHSIKFLLGKNTLSSSRVQYSSPLTLLQTAGDTFAARFRHLNSLRDFTHNEYAPLWSMFFGRGFLS